MDYGSPKDSATQHLETARLVNEQQLQALQLLREHQIHLFVRELWNALPEEERPAVAAELLRRVAAQCLESRVEPWRTISADRLLEHATDEVKQELAATMSAAIIKAIDTKSWEGRELVQRVAVAAAQEALAEVGRNGTREALAK